MLKPNTTKCVVKSIMNKLENQDNKGIVAELIEWMYCGNR